MNLEKITVDRLMTVAQYAAKIGKTSTAVYAMIRENNLKAIKIGKITLIVVS